jgi:2-dehydro-3-deoxyphosphogluconate aldolase/(4S)-4-hydroxy-2-oxoglutarate aldolase
MNPQAGLKDILRTAAVIPVVIIDDVAHAIPLGRALVAGGLPVIEITLRTAAGLDAIRAIASEVEGAIVGVGTVLQPAQYVAAAKAGAKFAVSPGATKILLDSVAERNYTFAKFFPAEPAGGAAYLSAIASPLPQLTFCPTGGITLESAPKYLKLGNVVCIGGSWMVARSAIAAADWPAITRAAQEAAALKKHRSFVLG